MMSSNRNEVLIKGTLVAPLWYCPVANCGQIKLAAIYLVLKMEHEAAKETHFSQVMKTK